MNLRIHANNNNNNNYNHHHLPGSPGGDCRSCSVPASFSPHHAVSHQAFSIYNINPHKKVQRAALANRVVGANQLNSLPSHSHIRTHTLSHSHSHTQSIPELTIFTCMFTCAQLTFARFCACKFEFAFDKSHSHSFTPVLTTVHSSVFNVSHGRYLNHARPVSSTTSFVLTNVPRHQLHSHRTSVELHCSATLHSWLKAERILQTWHGHFVLMLVTIFTFILISFSIIVLHYHTTGGPVFRLWSASPANVLL